MSELLNLNIDPITSWKGKTLSQITSTIRKNRGTIANDRYNYFLPNPLKLYRREIASPFYDKGGCSRTSVSIDEFDRPGGTINNASTQNPGGLVNTIDNTIPNNSCDTNPSCFKFLSISENAKRRCRSSGNISKKFDSHNRPQYYTDTKQYLVSRNFTNQQNEFKYSLTDSSYCTTYKPSNSRFAQQGGTSSSAMTARLRYDAITTSAETMKTSYGKATSNALAYGVAENGYTIKDKVGYPIAKYPSFSKTGVVTVCSNTSIR